MTDYSRGHVKRDPATGAIAIRTRWPEEAFPNLAWVIATDDIGARNATTAEVSDWDDLPLP